MQDKMQDEAGNIWEVDAQGNVVRLVQAAPSATRGRVFNLAPSPKEQRQEARQTAADQRAADADARSAAAAERAEREWNATHNPDGSPKAKAQGSGKPLPDGVAKRYEEAINAFAAFDRATGTFQDDFAGNSLTGGLENSIQSIAGGFGTPGQAQWWSDFKATDNVLRNALYGASLTAGEKSAYEATTISPRMDPAQIKANLTRRMALAKDLLSRRTNFLKSNGYDPDAVDALAGEYGDVIAGKAQQQADNEVPDPTTGAATKPGTSPVDPGAMPPANTPGGGQPNPPEPERYSVATGQTRTVHNAKISAQIDAMMNAGASEAMINAVLKQQGLAPIDPSSHARAKAWMRQNPGKRYYGTDINTEEPLSALEQAAANPWAAGVTGAANALTLGGLDEVVGGVEALRNGTSWEEETAKADGAKRAISALNPGSTITGELIGAGLQGVGAGKALSMFPNLAKAIATAPGTLAAGSAWGAVNGALEANDNRVGGALGGGLAGAGGAAAGRYVIAPAIEKGLRKFSGVQGVTSAERALPAVPESVLTNLQDAQRLGLPYALADADPKLRILAGSVARKSPDARQLAENTFEPRHLGQADRAVDAIDTHLAPITDIAERGGQHLNAARTASAPYYELARSRAAPVDDEVQALLRTEAGQDALRRAQTIASNEGRDPNAMGFDLDEQGQVVIRNMPSFETLDLVKRGFDARLAEARNPTTGVLDLAGNPELASIEGLRKRFVGRLDQLNEHYPEARAAYAEHAANKDALERGYAATTAKVRPRDLRRIVEGLQPTSLAEYQRGYGTQLADTVEQTRFASDPYKTIYGSPAQQEKVEMLFPEGAPTFRRVNELEQDMAKTRYEALGGSPTAARAAADQLFDGPAGSMLDVGTSSITGGGFPVATALKSGARLLGDNWRLGVGQKRADEMAPMLFGTNPDASIGFLEELFARQAALKARKQEYGARGALLGSIVAPTLIPAQ